MPAHCKQCGRELESTEVGLCRQCELATEAHDDRPEQHGFAGDLVTVGTYPNEQEASIAKATLAEEGINAFLLGDHSATMLWYVGSALGGVRLQVATGDAERARHLLQDDGDNDEPPPARPWTCAECGEKVDAGFAVCWSCGGTVAKPDEDADTERDVPSPPPAERLEPELDLNLETPLEDEIDANELTATTEGDKIAARAWRAAVIGIGLFPLLFYSLVLVLDASRMDLSPRGTRRFYGAMAVIALMFIIFWHVTQLIYRR